MTCIYVIRRLKVKAIQSSRMTLWHTSKRRDKYKGFWLSFNRTQSRVVIGLLTGHNTLRRHFHLMGLTIAGGAQQRMKPCCIIDGYCCCMVDRHCFFPFSVRLCYVLYVSHKLISSS
jgi:hypothetical protein